MRALTLVLVGTALIAPVSSSPSSEQTPAQTVIDAEAGKVQEAPGPQKRSAQLVISSEKEEYFGGTPIIVTLILKNLGQEVLYYNDYKQIVGYELVVTDAAGVRMPLTRQGEWLLSLASLPVAMAPPPGELAPSQEVRRPVMVSRIFDMTRAGVYFVSGSYAFTVKSSRTQIKVESRSLKVEVIEPRRE